MPELTIDDVYAAINTAALDGMTKLIARDPTPHLEIAATIDLDKLTFELNERGQP
ncbi:MAG: hypothetical protein ACTHKE_04285 [Sphingomicrobium sp.]